MKRAKMMFYFTLGCWFCGLYMAALPPKIEEPIETKYYDAIVVEEEPKKKVEPTIIFMTPEDEVVEVVEFAEIEDEEIIETTSDDLYLLALVCMAESEDQSELGQRLVIDTILNRVDSEDFPNDISSVIYQPGQFTSMHNGRADRVEPTDRIHELVAEELTNRTNTEVLYFRTGHYHAGHEQLMQEGDHYFSKE